MRVKLRTGQLDAAQRILEFWVAERAPGSGARPDPPAPRPPRDLLLLSLILAFRGDAERAFALAQEGIALGARLESPFITAVAQTRLGHAWQLRRRTSGRSTGVGAGHPLLSGGDRAGRQLAVRRMRAEAMWGLTRAYGFARRPGSRRGGPQPRAMEIGRVGGRCLDRGPGRAKPWAPATCWPGAPRRRSEILSQA